MHPGKTHAPLAFNTVGHSAPNTIYCHGLGAEWDQPLPMQLQDYLAREHARQFTRFQYRYTNDLSRPWVLQVSEPVARVRTRMCEQSWVDDIHTMINRCYAINGPVNLLACSAGAQAALQAAIGNARL
jgi:hypothetical protein